jgi:uncharacterized membrane protein
MSDRSTSANRQTVGLFVRDQRTMTLRTSKARGYQESLGCVLTFVALLAVTIAMLTRWLF